MRKICLRLLIISLSFFLFVPQVVADNHTNFHTSLETNYTVNIDGSTYVEHKFKIRNLTPEYYISKYGLKFSSPNLREVRVAVGNQKLDAEVVNSQKQTSIGITFPDKIVGQGKSRNFTITYLDDDLAMVTGQVLEVTIPKLSNPGDYQQYGVSLVIPASFGHPSRISPKNYTLEETPTHIKLNFDSLQGEGVSAIFGDEQIFDINLKYHLKNPYNRPARTQITIPPDTPLQRIHINQLDPKPIEMKIDPDGNWLATYRLDGNTAITVELSAQAQLKLTATNWIPNFKPNQKHTQSQKYWESEDAQIQSLAEQHPKPRDIYDLVVDQLDYTTEKLTLDRQRMGAANSLLQPDNAACQEFTDLFIAIARAANIPARRMIGYAYAQNEELRPLSFVQDVLHTWPEYFDPQQQAWVPVDPTWGDTTGGVDYFNQFDLNHVVFAINGESSILPFPAGAYKAEDKPEKNVTVEFGQDFPVITPDISYRLSERTVSFLPLPGFYNLELTNNSGQAWYDLDLQIISDQSTVKLTSTSNQLPYLLPFQTVAIPITVYNNQGWLPQENTFTLIVKASQQSEQSYEIVAISAPKVIEKLTNPKTLIVVGSGFIIIALSAGSVLVYRRRRQNSLRRQS